MSDKILLVCNKSMWCDMAGEFIKDNFIDVTPVFWNTGDPYPSEVDNWEGDWILSFRGDFILSPETLSRAAKGAINFHPSTPKYRGIGSHHYAIYNGDKQFGITCHHINEQIDQGTIIKVDHFAIAENESASSLGLRVGAYCLVVFYDFVNEHIIGDKPIEINPKEQWDKTLYTNKSLALWKQQMMEQHPGHKCLQ